MRGLYHPAMYDTAVPIASYWAASAGPWDEGRFAPLEGDAEAEVAIIGGGYTGLSAAYHLARERGVAARVLEAGPIGWGASGRNGGFCSLGGAKLSYEGMLACFGEVETRRFVKAQCEAVELVRALAGEEGIALDAQGEGALNVAHRPSRMAELEAASAITARLGGGAGEIWSRDELAERGYRSPEAFGAWRTIGFGLHPLKYCRGLADAAHRRGALIHARSPVIGWEREGAWHRLRTPRGTVRARQVIVATNAFTRDELHPGLAGTLLPALTNIIVTRPLADDEISAQGCSTEMPVWDTRTLLFYVRLLPDRRFMFGARGGLSAAPGAAGPQRAWMMRRFGAMYPAWRAVAAEYFWRGPVCISAALTPHVAPLDDVGTYCALGYHGSGVALGTWSGRAVAALALGVDGAAAAIPAAMARPPRRFPIPILRRLYRRGAYYLYRLRDEVP
jgi:glycine/D-amino acid oxidase-like deaminating enzyme